MRLLITSLAACLAVCGTGMALAQPPAGWEPFAARFDPDKPVLLKGPIVGVEWVSPRILVTMRSAADGRVWVVEGGSPEAAVRGGLTRENFGPGVEIIVRGYQARDGSNHVTGRDVTFADGRKAGLEVQQQGPNPPGWEPFAARYDGNAPVLLKGHVTAADWSGPRTRLEMTAEGADPGRWTLDLGATVTAKERFDPAALKPGAVVTVRGYRAKDGSALAAVRDITFADGTKIFNGGGAAPRG